MRKTAAASLVYRADVGLTGPITSGEKATRHPWLPTCGLVRMSTAPDTALRALWGADEFLDRTGARRIIADYL